MLPAAHVTREPQGTLSIVPANPGEHKGCASRPFVGWVTRPYAGAVTTPLEPAGPTPPTGTARTLLTLAGLVVAAQALALIALAVAEVAAIDASRVGLGASTAVFLGAFGIALLLGVSRVLKGESWARGLLVFTQLIVLLLSWNFRADDWWIPVTMAGGALLVLGCLLSPPVTRALADPPPETDENDRVRD